MDVELVAAALLHDVLEDSGVTPATLREHFGADVVRLVEAVTRAQSVPKEEYLAALSKAESRTVALKVADRTDNLRDLVLQPDRAFGLNYLAETRRYVVPLARGVADDLEAHFARALEAAVRHFES